MLTSREQVNSVSALYEEIARLRDTILFCENKIMRKQIAIAELMDRDLVQEAAPVQQSQERTEGAQAGAKVAVTDMVKEILPKMNGSTFWYSDIKAATIAAHPADEGKIRRGVYVAVNRLIETGVVERVEGGLRRK